jgi:hypothetical protein
MIDSFFASYSTGRSGVGGPEVGPKTVVAVSVIATGLGILYLVTRKPDAPGSPREAGPKAGPGPSRSPRADQVRGWGNYQ